MAAASCRPDQARPVEVDHSPITPRAGPGFHGVHWASIGWILPLLHDPDGHEVRFYTQQHHTEPEPGRVTTIQDPRETAERHEQAAT